METPCIPASGNRALYAANPALGRGREFGEPQGGVRGPRSPYQRDRDRIVHSIAFRRLRHKTQVFVAPDGDHFRTRLTHSLEVAQIGRVLARALGLDEDLTEALCLAHDIGHPPFGHAGEHALDRVLEPHGGFDHNANTLRVVMRLESPYCTHDGLNLSWEVLEGLAKHNGPIAPGTALPWALDELNAAWPLDLATWPTLEAQVAAIADDIAYDNHDIDDGLRAGFLTLEQLFELDFLAEDWLRLQKVFPGAPQDRLQRELVRGQIGRMVNDVLDETRRRIACAGIGTLADVRHADGALVGFSPAGAAREHRLKRFLHTNLYFHPSQERTAQLADDLLTRLFGAYKADPLLLPPDWQAALPAHEPGRSRRIADYLSGMTDLYAIRCHTALFGPPPEELVNV
ncbi:deoxyguanosinetriphosphate triphosphohydrolase [Croceicoccus sp. F390]|uniref:Deoxyguanosinetriphosphate triphosphohydrolase-like protein n=1 Tax=Croceicoccus esteveae TaxID=3075597 RepID=A0ABU2ZEI9_9SPHN|nr:deoxyguanosinetriphosphate triphosphohydrolase [Croceicoccus sp. F390]MDT0575019.1 deoxyguanosinetriphosphate triphosphohydrolase [Croceicoccus sp. F390]